VSEAAKQWQIPSTLNMCAMPLRHSNEITAIPKRLTLIGPQGMTITIDAMGTQAAIAEQIIAGKAGSSTGVIIAPRFGQ